MPSFPKRLLPSVWSSWWCVLTTKRGVALSGAGASLASSAWIFGATRSNWSSTIKSPSGPLETPMFPPSPNTTETAPATFSARTTVSCCWRPSARPRPSSATNGSASECCMGSSLSQCHGGLQARRAPGGPGSAEEPEHQRERDRDAEHERRDAEGEGHLGERLEVHRAGAHAVERQREQTPDSAPDQSEDQRL